MAEGFFTCNTGWTGAESRVAQQFTLINAYADKSLSSTFDVVNKVGAVQLPSLTFNLDPLSLFNVSIKGYDAPPTLSGVDMQALDGQLPASPIDLPPVTLNDLGPVPPQPATPPTPAFDAEPTVYSPQFQAPVVLTLPDPPGFTDRTSGIPVPVLRTITVPVAPDVNLDAIVFNVDPPTFNVPAPDPNDFAYAEPDYEPKLLADVQPVIRSMLAGQSGLPPSVEAMIFSREADREDEEAFKAREDAMDGMAARGTPMRSGTVAKALRMVRETAQKQKNAKSREIAINTREILLKQLSEAIAQSIAYEDIFVRLFNEQQNRKLQAARFAIDLAIAVYNAEVARFQAEAQVYKIQSDVYLARIQAALAKLQAFSEEIKAQQLIGELNEQDIRIYTARLQAVETNIRAYVADTEAYKNIIDGARLKLENAKLLIDEELAKLNASEIQSKIWLGQAQQQGIVQQAFATRAQTFVAAMQGYDTRARVEIARLQADVANKNAVSQRYEALIQGFTALVNYIKTRADLTIANNEQKVQVYTAATQGKSAYNQTLIEQMKAVNQGLVEKTRILLENSSINKQNLIEGVRILLGKLEAMSNVLAGVGQAALSGMHVGAQISDSSTVGSSCNFNTSQTIGS